MSITPKKRFAIDSLAGRTLDVAMALLTPNAVEWREGEFWYKETNERAQPSRHDHQCLPLIVNFYLRTDPFELLSTATGKQEMWWRVSMPWAARVMSKPILRSPFAEDRNLKIAVCRCILKARHGDHVYIREDYL